MTDKELRKAKKDELKAENDRLRAKLLLLSGEVGAEPPADGAGDADA